MLGPSFRRSIGACAVALLAAGALRGAHAQVAGGDIRFGLWSFLHGEHERWPELGGRVRLGRDGSRTQAAINAGVAFDPVFGGSWQALGAMVLHEPGVLGRRLWYVGAGYTALYASGAGAAGFAHGAEALIGVHLGRGMRSRWSLESRLVVGPSRERDDGSREVVRYLAIGFARRLGPPPAWRAEP